MSTEQRHPVEAARGLDRRLRDAVQREFIGYEDYEAATVKLEEIRTEWSQGRLDREEALEAVHRLEDRTLGRS